MISTISRISLALSVQSNWSTFLCQAASRFHSHLIIFHLSSQPSNNLRAPFFAFCFAFFFFFFSLAALMTQSQDNLYCHWYPSNLLIICFISFVQWRSWRWCKIRVLILSFLSIFCLLALWYSMVVMAGDISAHFAPFLIFDSHENCYPPCVFCICPCGKLHVFSFLIIISLIVLESVELFKHPVNSSACLY